MIKARSRWRWMCVVSAFIALGSTATAAQDQPWWAVDLSQPALTLVGATDPRTPALVGVLPIATANSEMIRIADEVTAQLIWHLQAVPHAVPLQLQPIARPAPAAAPNVKRVTGRPPLGDADIRRAGQQAAAAYVVSGVLTEARNRLPSRVDLRLTDIRTGQTLATASARFTFPGARPAEPSRPILKSKPFVAAVGALATAAATYAAFRANSDLKEENRALQAVPAGATDEWTRVHDAASGTARERNFWWGVSIGLAGVTTSYMVLAEERPGGRRPAPTWRLGLNGPAPQISLVRTF